ncbi:MAG: prenyltransferase/squalene oxidase repeat-containing protein, partial [bacterium]
MNKWKCLIVAILLLANQAISQTAIERGVEWLIAAQNPNGSWGTETEYPNLVFRDTCIVADALCYLALSGSPTTLNAISWISTQPATFTRNLSRKIIPLANFGTDTSELINLLVSYQNDDGGWSGYDFKGGESFVLDTLLSLNALKSANYTNNSVIEPALLWLLANQNTDGGFGLQESNVYLTSLAILTLNQYRKDYYLEEPINKASDWLITQTPETLWEKALMYQATRDKDLLEDILQNQRENGSWDNDPFTTALCLRAIKDAAPDLIVSEILFDPQVPLEGETTTI